MTMILIRLAIRLVVFTLVFWLAAKKNPKIVITPRWALPLVAAVFALLNTGLYWLLKPVFQVATFGALAFVMPLLVNAALLYATLFLMRRRPKADKKGVLVERKQLVRIDGIFAMGFMAIVLTVAHCLLWVALDYAPSRF